MKDYSEFVVHPIYGQGPRMTGVGTAAEASRPLAFGWDDSPAIPGTGIKVQMTDNLGWYWRHSYYFDREKVCEDCKRPFLYFAEEQGYWHEVLLFKDEAHCVRCHECRKADQHIRSQQDIYRRLIQISNPSAAESIELSLSILELVEHGVFGRKSMQRIPKLLSAMTGPFADRQLVEHIRERYDQLKG